MRRHVKAIDLPAEYVRLRATMHRARMFTECEQVLPSRDHWLELSHSEAAPDGAHWLGHAGSVPGFISRTLFRPDDGVGVIVLLNGVADAGKLAMELATLAAGALRTRPEPEPSAPPAPPPVEVERLLGPYRDDDSGTIIHVEWRDGQLTLVGERDADVLVATGDASVWTVRSGRPAGEAARFLADDRGVVTGLNVAGYPYRRLCAKRG